MIKSEGIATVCKQYKTNGISECSTESTYEPIENYEAGYAPVDHSVIENYVIKNTVYDLPLAQCKVYTVTNESSEKFILKVIEKDGLSQMMTAKAREECVIQSQLQHENIAKLHHYSETPTTIELVMEHCNQYSYFEERLEENSDPIEDGVKLKKYVTEILRALEYIHSKGIVHADIKLANICLHKDSDGEETIKLIDFGLSLVTNAQNNGKAYMKSPIGTLGYMAPEIKGVSTLSQHRSKFDLERHHRRP